MSDKPESDFAVPGQRTKRSLFWRMLRAFALLCLFVVLTLVGLYFYNRHSMERALAEAIAETDRVDPEWRLEQFEKKRVAMPDEENAAIHVLAAAALIASPWTRDDDILNIDEPPQFQFDPALIEKLRVGIGDYKPVAVAAEKASALKTGRYQIQWKNDGIGMLIPHLEKTRNLASFLQFVALLQNQDGEHDKAWRTTLMILAIARSYGDEPLAISQLIRQFHGSRAMAGFERCLAQGKVDDALLAEAQMRLAEELTEPLFYHAMRGERAFSHLFFVALESGEVDRTKVFGAKRLQDVTSVNELIAMLQTPAYKAQHASMLLHMNDVVTASKLPPKELLRQFQALDDKARSDRGMSKEMVSAFLPIARAHVHYVARLECVRAGIAVERFRLQHKRWPDSLDEVVAAKLLDKVPLDPFDEQPLRFRRTADGVVVYSIGVKKDYAGDALDVGREFNPDTIRSEFRLWDEPHRRQPPRAKQEEKKDDGELPR